MSEGPATFGGVEGRGLMRTVQPSPGSLKRLDGYFMPADNQNAGRLVDMGKVEYVGPVEEGGVTRQMRVDAFVRQWDSLGGGRAILTGSGVPRPVD